MKNKTLYMVKNDDDDGWFLRSTNDGWDKSRLAQPEDTTLENIVDLLDGDAESANVHDFVTTHRALAALLIREVGRDTATKIFIRLVDFGGLHGLTGIGGDTDIKDNELELGVKLRCWLGDGWKF